MKLLEERIVKDGVIKDGDILKVDGFLNHRMDVGLFNEMGREFHRLFGDERITKILTIEASGIGIACITAQYFSVPVLFAKKSKSSNIGDDVYSAEAYSYTHGNVYRAVVSKKYLTAEDRVLIIDDFLALGGATNALLGVCEQAGATVVGAGIAVEKAYQGGGDKLRERGIRVESLAKIRSMSVENGIRFCD